MWGKLHLLLDIQEFYMFSILKIPFSTLINILKDQILALMIESPAWNMKLPFEKVYSHKFQGTVVATVNYWNWINLFSVFIIIFTNNLKNSLSKISIKSKSLSWINFGQINCIMTKYLIRIISASVGFYLWCQTENIKHDSVKIDKKHSTGQLPLKVRITLLPFLSFKKFGTRTKIVSFHFYDDTQGYL